MNEKIDFTDCPRIPGKAYSGANGKKICIEYDNKLYMLKFPPSGKDKRTALSYTNSCLSEHIASSIFNMLGVDAQKTMLGTFSIEGKEKVVCACQDFTANGEQLFDFCSIKNTVLDSETNGTGTELDDILDTIEKQTFVDPFILTEHFWNMFVVDALLGNFDRHNGNWGFLYDPAARRSSIAPVFDCGSCLLPQADEEIMSAVLSDEHELNARIYTFPASAIRQQDKKINYYDFLISTDNADCISAVKRIYERIDIAQITEFIESVPYITELQREFYERYVSARYDLILRPAYEMAMVQSQDNGWTMSELQ